MTFPTSWTSTDPRPRNPPRCRMVAAIGHGLRPPLVDRRPPAERLTNEQHRIDLRPRGSRLPGQPDRRGSRRAGRRLRPGHRPVAPAPASTRPSSCATVTSLAVRGQGCPPGCRQCGRRDRPRGDRHGRPRPGRARCRLIELDGTENKGNLGANAILGVSLAARAPPPSPPACPSTATSAVSAPHLPVPQFNCLNGGAHAQTSVDFQEFMFIPLGMPSFAEALRAGSECFHALRAVLKARGTPPDRATRAVSRPP